MNPQGRSFGIPALYSMQSLQQVVMTSGSVGALPTVVTMVPCQQPNLTTLSALPQNPPVPPPPPQPITTAPTPKPASPPTPQLYLCRTSNNATEPPSEEGEGGREKASLELLQHDYHDLNTRKIKDSLSSFLPDIPGDFDSTGSTNTMLKHLLEQRAIGNREFLPLSGQALLGFRLLPGALPEQYRIDPPSLESKHHHKRKKHKRKPIEKAAEDGGDMGPPAAKAKMPSDAFTFIKHEQPHSHYPPAPSQVGHAFSGSPMVQTTSVIQHSFSTSMGGGGSVTATTMGPGFMQGGSHSFPGQEKRKKEKKKNKEKKKEKKEKKKKRDKHHSQDPSGPGAPPPGGGPSGPALPHPSAQYSSYSHP